MDLYKAEEIDVPSLEFEDNQDALDLIIKRTTGIFPLLDEEGLIPRGSDDGFLSKVIKTHETHEEGASKGANVGKSNSTLPESKRFQNKTKLRAFAIRHYAGEVVYTPQGFLNKNNDKLSPDVVELLSASTLGLAQNLFSASADEERDRQNQALLSANSSSSSAGSSSAPPKGVGGKQNKMTVSKRFVLQLDALVLQLNTTRPMYVRCIKPNPLKKANIVDANLVNEQLTYAGVFEAVTIMQSGYPCRMTHAQFASKYHPLCLRLSIKAAEISRRPPGYKAPAAPEEKEKKKKRGAASGKNEMTQKDPGYQSIFPPHHVSSIFSDNETIKFERM